jgi:hypothetical protein
MESMLREIGFKDIIHFKSGTEGYPKCLATANVEILTMYMNEPILLLEDDVEFTGISEFDFVHGADAIYFGLSTCGSHPIKEYNDRDSEFTQYSDTQVRVQNMLGTHAIMYITPRYKQAVIDILKDRIGHTDIAITRIQPNFRILANRTPSFFQSAKFNAPDHLDSYTNFVITENLITRPSIRFKLSKHYDSTRNGYL